MEINKEKHINLLLAENKKNSKKKRVSFSIFKAETFEEIEQLRKMKESALSAFQMQKTKTNEYRDMISRNLRMNSSESKSNDSLSGRNDSIESENRNNRKGSRSSMDNDINNNKLNDDDKQLKENAAVIGNANIKAIKKENEQLVDIKQIEKERKRKEVEDKKKKDKEIKVKEKETEEQAIQEQLKNEEEEKRIANENTRIKNEKAEKQSILNEEKIKKEIEEKLRLEIEEKLRKENEEIIRKEIEEKIQKENEERLQRENEARIQREKEEKIQREKELQIQRENEERIQRENGERSQREKEEQLQREKEEQHKRDLELKKQKDIIILNTILSSIINSNKQKYINYALFKSNCINHIIKKEDDFINYESTNPEYASYISKKHNYYLFKINLIFFLFNARVNINRRRKQNLQIAKAKKYILYRNYKQKAIIFEALYSYARKQRNWITSIRNELSKGLLWSCLDSLKIYSNYKKIKAYLRLQKQRKIFYGLRKNVKTKYDLKRKSHTAFLIFIYKNFFAKIRKDILIKKGRECDEYISSEFRKQTLLKKVFGLIQIYYSIKKEKMKKTKKLFQVKHQNSEFINIKISQKETIKYSNKNIVTKQTSNRINIV